MRAFPLFESQLRIQPNDWGVALTHVSNDDLKPVLPGVLDLPFLHHLSKALPSTFRCYSSANNPQRPRPRCLVVVYIVHDCGTADDLSVDDHPLRLELRPLLRAEKVSRKLSERPAIKVEKSVDLVGYDHFSEFSAHIALASLAHISRYSFNLVNW